MDESYAKIFKEIQERKKREAVEACLLIQWNQMLVSMGRETVGSADKDFRESCETYHRTVEPTSAAPPSPVIEVSGSPGDSSAQSSSTMSSDAASPSVQANLASLRNEQTPRAVASPSSSLPVLNAGVASILKNRIGTIVAPTTKVLSGAQSSQKPSDSGSLRVAIAINFSHTPEVCATAVQMLHPNLKTKSQEQLLAVETDLRCVPVSSSVCGYSFNPNGMDPATIAAAVSS